MSDFCVIADQVIPVASAKENIVRVGPPDSRAYNTGALLSTVRAEKRTWQITTGLMLDAAIDALETAVAFGVSVTCTGNAFRTTRTCRCVVGDIPYSQVVSDDGKNFMRTIAINAEEV